MQINILNCNAKISFRNMRREMSLTFQSQGFINEMDRENRKIKGRTDFPLD